MTRVANVCNCEKPTDAYEEDQIYLWGGGLIGVSRRVPQCKRCKGRVQRARRAMPKRNRVVAGKVKV